MDPNRTLLSSWDQFAPRSYIRQVFCFPCDTTSDEILEPLRARLSVALARAARHFPDLVGQVILGTAPAGRLWISQNVHSQATLEVLDHRETFAWSYADLAAQGFPGHAFVGPDFYISQTLSENGPGLPVSVIQARVIRGGLLLCFNVYHAVTDGLRVTAFVSAVAAYSRNINNADYTHHGHSPGSHLELPEHSTSRLANDIIYDVSTNDHPGYQGHIFKILLKQCPEYLSLSTPRGPLAPRCSPSSPPLDSIQKTGRIFTLGLDKISALKAAAQKWRPGDCALRKAATTNYPSTFACLAALVWAYTTILRLEAACGCDIEKVIDQNPSLNEGHYRLLLPASWAKRAFTDSTQSYAGNAVAIVILTTSLRGLLDTVRCSPDTMATTGQAFASLVHSIETALASINETFVGTRTAMMRIAPDPCLTGIDLNPQDPRDFIVNSWRHLGADTLWNLPGVVSEHGRVLATPGGVRPDAVRRAANEWNMGAALIMPGHRESEKYEVLMTLDSVSMERLVLHGGWSKWTSFNGLGMR